MQQNQAHHQCRPHKHSHLQNLSETAPLPCALVAGTRWFALFWTSIVHTQVIQLSDIDPAESSKAEYSTCSIVYEEDRKATIWKMDTESMLEKQISQLLPDKPGNDFKPLSEEEIKVHVV